MKERAIQSTRSRLAIRWTYPALHFGLTVYCKPDTSGPFLCPWEARLSLYLLFF